MDFYIKRNWLIALLFSATFFFNGCVPTARLETVKNYSIGDTKTVNVGEPIIDVKENMYKKECYLTAKGNLQGYKKGEVIAGYFSEKKQECSFPKGLNDIFARVRMTNDGKVNGEQVFDITYGYTGRIGSKQYELLYLGKFDNNVKIGFREYVVSDQKNTFIRDAFNYDVVYNLSDNKTIAFKKFLIEIIEANNQHITYVVKQDL